MRTAPIAPASSTSSTRHSWWTTPRSIAGSRTARYAVDTRLRDRLRALGVRSGRRRRLSGIDRPASRTCARRPRSPASTRRSRSPTSALALGARADGRRVADRGLEPSAARADPCRALPGGRDRDRDRGSACSPSSRRVRPLSCSSSLALAVFWFEALGWPMAKGRDTWDYLVYYLQLADADPPISELQLFRTPLTPIVLGHPAAPRRQRRCSRSSSASSTPSTILAWSATALTFGRIPALFTAGLLLVYPAFATLYHQASSDAVFATGLALWALAARAHDASALAAGASPRSAPGSPCSSSIRPANQVLLPLAFVPLLVSVAWRTAGRLVGRLPRGAVALLGGWALAQRRSLRRRDRRARRSRLGAVPPRLPGRPDDRPGERRRVAAARRPDRGRGAREGAARAASTYRSTRTSRTARTTRPSG